MEQSVAVEERALTVLPLGASAVWMSKTVTTDPPKLTPRRGMASTGWDALGRHSPWGFIYRPTHVHWALRPEDPSDHIEVSLDFFPYACSTDATQVNFGWERFAVNDEDLKAEPKTTHNLLLPSNGTTGRFIDICELPRHSTRFAIIAVAEEDGENRRQERWRLRPDLAAGLPPELVAITSGRGRRHQR